MMSDNKDTHTHTHTHKHTHRNQLLRMDMYREQVHATGEQLNELRKAIEEIRNARRAALNVMEDAVESREALRKSEERLQQLNESLEKQVQERTKELEKSRAELERTANYIQRVTQTVPDMISVMELETQEFQYINASSFNNAGFDIDKMQNKSPEERRQMIHPGDQEVLDDYFSTFDHLSDDETTTAEYRAKNFAGEWLWFKVSGRVFLRNGSGKPTHILNVIQNITAEKKAEEKINRLNQDLMVKNRQLEALSSELTTFNTIAATDYAETLKHLYTSLEFLVTNDARNLSNAGRANIRRSQAAIQKIKLLTDDIVAYSNLYATEADKVPVHLDEIISAVQNDMKAKIMSSNAVVECEACPTIQGFPVLLSLLFHHLIDNAIKFRKEDQDPVIKIRSCHVAGSGIDHPSAQSELDYNVVSVIDNGVGFAAADNEKIFRMFARLHEKGKYKGSGIGLAICKKIMDIHDGFIEARSVEGEGSTFSCYFPVVS